MLVADLSEGTAFSQRRVFSDKEYVHAFHGKIKKIAAEFCFVIFPDNRRGISRIAVSSLDSHAANAVTLKA